MNTETKDNQDPEMGKLLDSTNESKSSPTKDTTAYKDSKGYAGKAVSACALYIFCSVSMVLVNKSLASR